jgi:hypothetical protein
MNNEQKQQQPVQPGTQQADNQQADNQQADNLQAADQTGASQQQQQQPDTHPDFDALANKKPEELTPEELRLMADTMPGEGPGD